MKLKQLLRHSLIYSMGTLFTQGITFFLIPMYTRYLTPADYGIIETLNAIGSVVSIVYIMGLDGALTRFYFQYDDLQERKEYFGTILLFLTIAALCATILLNTVASPLLGTLIGDIPFRPYVSLTLWTCFFLTAIALSRALFRAREEPIKFISIQIVQAVLTAVSIICFVAILKEGALGKVKGGFYISVLFFVVGVCVIGKNSSLSFSFVKLKESLRFGLPLIPHLIAGWILNLSDRFFLQHYAGLGTVGLYSLGYNLGMVMHVVVTSFNNAWSPFFFSTAKDENNASGIFPKITTYYLVGILTMGLALSLFSRELVLLVGTPKFYDAFKVVPIIVLSYILRGIYLMLTNQIFYSKKTGYLPFLTGLASVTNIILNFLLVPKFGMMGAAFSTLFSFIMHVLLAYLVSNKVYTIDYEYRRIYN